MNRKLLNAAKKCCLLPLLSLIVLWPALSLSDTLPDHVISQFGEPPSIPVGALNEDLQRSVDMALVNSVTSSGWGRDQQIALGEIAESNDPRIAWPITDLMRFVSDPQLSAELAGAAAKLLGISLNSGNQWGIITDHLIAWNIPAPPDYLRVKRAIFTSIVPGWDKLFIEGDIDWRHVSWGGVRIDDRPFDTTDDICNCIPAADNPPLDKASDATWLRDTDTIFGIVLNGEARAYPRRIMEVREMVNDTLGGRDLGIPYCTLCGAAQAYFTDELPTGIDRPVLRTSGLLIRSNKVMYDISSNSVFDTFFGKAVTGPLAEKKVQLESATVITTTWGQWKEAYPDTTVLKESLALGRDFDFRNNRDASGPIFPVGDIDPRFPVHEDMVGAITASGKPIAFQQSKAMAALIKEEPVEVENLRLALDGGGIKVIDKQGKPVSSHQAFWFAWSQFHPGTDIWPK